VLPSLMPLVFTPGLLAPEAPKGFMDTLPDPMKLDGATLIFVIVLITLLFIFMKFVFFKPLVQVMDEREAAIQSGAARRAEATALVEQRQAEYTARLRELRAQAFEHRKALATAAAADKTTLLERARQEASVSRAAALEELTAARAAARTELMAQVDALSESMVQHLLKRA